MHLRGSVEEGVIQVCTSPSWGGLEMHVPNLARHLMKRGYGVAVICRKNSPIHDIVKREGIPHLSLKGSGYLAPVSVYAVRQFLVSSGYRLIHSHFSRDLWKVVPAVKWSRSFRLIHTRHIHSGIMKRDPLHRWLFDRVDGWIATSNDGRANLLKTHPVAPDRVSVVRSGVDVSKHRGDPKSGRRVRRELGIDEETLVVGMLGRLTPRKGHRVFLRAATRVLRETDRKVVFLVVGGPSQGEDAYGEALERAVADMDMQRDVRLVGHREDVEDVLSAMDIYVLPSEKESFGISLLEAMSNGLPVVATAVGGPLEVIVDGESGILIPSRDPVKLAGAVLQLIEETGLRERLGRMARERVRRHFSEESMVDGILRVYEAVAGEPAGGAGV